MLAKLGCTFVVVGHSERREYHNEDDELVNRKVKAALKHGMTPILCVGERLEVREAGEPRRALHHAAHRRPEGPQGRAGQGRRGRLRAGLGDRHRQGRHPGGRPGGLRGASGRTLAEKYGDEVASAVRVLYGGSVKSGNIADLVAQDDIDGALVGGASLDGDEFAKLCALAAGGPLP